jgi:hypothetical protein
MPTLNLSVGVDGIIPTPSEAGMLQLCVSASFGNVQLGATRLSTAQTVILQGALSISGNYLTNTQFLLQGISDVDPVDTRAGEGNDVVLGGSGNDSIFGNQGTDLIYAGAGNDSVSAGQADYLVLGEDGNDFLCRGCNGADTTMGGLGNEGDAVSLALAGALFEADSVFTFGNRVDIITDFNADAVGDQPDVQPGTGISGIGVANHALAAGTNYFLAEAWDADALTFTFAVEGTCTDTWIIQGYGGAGVDIDTNLSAMILESVDRDHMLAGNYT